MKSQDKTRSLKPQTVKHFYGNQTVKAIVKMSFVVDLKKSPVFIQYRAAVNLTPASHQEPVTGAV